MSFGTRRHIADLMTDAATQEGQKYIGLQMGTNQVASQKGLSFGTPRGIADLHIGDTTKEGQGVISLQNGI